MDGEKVLLSCRTHWKNYVLPFMGAGTCLLFLLIRLYFYGYPLIIDFYASLSVEVNYRAVSLVESLLAALFTLWLADSGFRQVMVRYVITDQRLIHHSGFFNTRTTELKLCYCSNLILDQNIWGKILCYGDFKLRSGGVDMFFNDVPHPLDFKRILTRAIENAEYANVSRRTNSFDMYQDLQDDLGMNV